MMRRDNIKVELHEDGNNGWRNALEWKLVCDLTLKTPN